MAARGKLVPVYGSGRSVFATFEKKAYPFIFDGELHVDIICGGIPSDPKVAEGWLKTKLGATSEELMQAAVAEVMVERGIAADAAAEVVAARKHLNGFKRDEKGLYIEGRQLKSAIKEAGNVRWPSPARWYPSSGLRKSTTDKGDAAGVGKLTPSFFAEHIFVVEDRLYLSKSEPDGVNQRFVRTWAGSGIQYEEYAQDVTIPFTLMTDYAFTEEQWALMWLTGQQQGLGATRSQGYGRYEVTKWQAR